MVPPPTSFFAFVSARSGSMPVVSQSIIRPMVPVGASTVACELRTPYCSPSSTASCQLCWAADSNTRATHCCGAARQQLRRHELLVDLRRLGAVHPQHVEHRVLVVGVARERTHATRRTRPGGGRRTRLL